MPSAGITNDPLTHTSVPPAIIDLYDTLLHMGGTGPQLAQRLRKYTTGTFAGIFSQQSNIDINNPMVVFNLRDLEDELRPVAMYIVLNYIWNKTKTDQKRRILVVDEAWQLMKYEDSANFLFSLAKRARKYNLGDHHYYPGRGRFHGLAHGPGHRGQRLHAIPTQAVAIGRRRADRRLQTHQRGA